MEASEYANSNSWDASRRPLAAKSEEAAVAPRSVRRKLHSSPKIDPAQAKLLYGSIDGKEMQRRRRNERAWASSLR